MLKLTLILENAFLCLRSEAWRVLSATPGCLNWLAVMKSRAGVGAESCWMGNNQHFHMKSSAMTSRSAEAFNGLHASLIRLPVGCFSSPVVFSEANVLNRLIGQTRLWVVPLSHVDVSLGWHVNCGAYKQSPVGRQTAFLGTCWQRCNPRPLGDPRTRQPDTGNLSGWPDHWLLQSHNQKWIHGRCPVSPFFFSFRLLGSCPAGCWGQEGHHHGQLPVPMLMPWGQASSQLQMHGFGLWKSTTSQLLALGGHGNITQKGRSWNRTWNNWIFGSTAVNGSMMS